MDDNQIEKEIRAKGLTAPRVTPGDLAANITSEHYFTAWDGAQLAYWGDSDPENPKPEDGAPKKDGPLALLTFCVLVLKNGFTVTGESACASPENFDADIGRKIARENAVNRMWPLMGYALKQRLHDNKCIEPAPTASGLPPHQQRVIDEKAELDDKLTKLDAFTVTDRFLGLPLQEQSRMVNQSVHMRNYSEVLGARIAAF